MFGTWRRYHMTIYSLSDYVHYRNNTRPVSYTQVVSNSRSDECPFSPFYIWKAAHVICLELHVFCTIVIMVTVCICLLIIYLTFKDHHTVTFMVQIYVLWRRCNCILNFHHRIHVQFINIWSNTWPWLHHVLYMYMYKAWNYPNKS